MSVSSWSDEILHLTQQGKEVRFIMSKSSALKVADTRPLMLRRVTKKPQLPGQVMNNMTVVTSPGRPVEMSDQMEDAPAPRHDE